MKTVRRVRSTECEVRSVEHRFLAPRFAFRVSRFAVLRRFGYTLLEIVLALGLSSLLLAALYTALQMHWSSSTLGQVEMERSQVARALFRRIETDLRSVVFRESALTSSTDDGSTSSTTSSTSSSSTNSGTSTSGTSTSSGTSTNGASTSSSSSTSSSTTTDNNSTQKTGLYGDSATIVAHVSLPGRAENLGAASGNNATSSYVSSDLQSVAYFLLGSGSTLAQQISGSLNSPLGKQATGLARLQGDRMAMQAADESGDLSSMASSVKVLAPEVASIQFEYFDGVSWTTSWDSATSNSIPNAIRITIEFLPPPTTGGWYARPVSVSTDRFQHTIALPLAQPYVAEDTL